MTIILVLGLFAGLYLLSLVVRLAVHALPFYVGLALALWLHAHGQGYPAAILAAVITGIVTWATGQAFFAHVRSPGVRLGIAALFVVPAGFAGYQAVHGLAGLMVGAGPLLTLISLIGGGGIAGMAWSQLSAGNRAQSTATGRLQSGNAN